MERQHALRGRPDAPRPSPSASTRVRAQIAASAAVFVCRKLPPPNKGLSYRHDRLAGRHFFCRESAAPVQISGADLPPTESAVPAQQSLG